MTDAERALLLQMAALLLRLQSGKPGKMPLSEMQTNLVKLTLAVEHEATVNETENYK